MSTNNIYLTKLKKEKKRKTNEQANHLQEFKVDSTIITPFYVIKSLYLKKKIQWIRNLTIRLVIKIKTILLLLF